MHKNWVAPIQAALRRRNQGVTVNFSAAWRAIAEEYGVGVKVGRRELRLEDGELDSLSGALSYFLKVEDPLHVDLTSDRLTLAEKSPQEKLSSTRALSLVRIASTDGYVIVLEQGTGNSLSLDVPAGTVLSVSPKQLELEGDDFQNFVIIENGAAIENWWRIMPLLPEKLQTNTLFIYRGHGNEQRHLLERLTSLCSEKARLYFFGDYDPSGIYIALSSIAKRMAGRSLRIIAPRDLSDITPEMSKDDVFLKQRKNLEWVLAHPHLSEAVQTLVSHISSNGFSVTQETLIAQKIPLDTYLQENP